MCRTSGPVNDEEEVFDTEMVEEGTDPDCQS